jgi:hypothetical protein
MNMKHQEHGRNMDTGSDTDMDTDTDMDRISGHEHGHYKYMCDICIVMGSMYCCNAKSSGILSVQ